MRSRSSRSCSRASTRSCSSRGGAVDRATEAAQLVGRPLRRSCTRASRADAGRHRLELAHARRLGTRDPQRQRQRHEQSQGRRPTARLQQRRGSSPDSTSGSAESHDREARHVGGNGDVGIELSHGRAAAGGMPNPTRQRRMHLRTARVVLDRGQPRARHFESPRTTPLESMRVTRTPSTSPSVSAALWGSLAGMNPVRADLRSSSAPLELSGAALADPVRLLDAQGCRHHREHDHDEHGMRNQQAVHAATASCQRPLFANL